MSNSKTLDLIDGFSDDMRLPFIADNPDWDKISPALYEFAQILEIQGFNLNTSPILRVLFEVVYVMGYQSGKDDCKRRPYDA